MTLLGGGAATALWACSGPSFDAGGAAGNGAAGSGGGGAAGTSSGGSLNVAGTSGASGTSAGGRAGSVGSAGRGGSAADAGQGSGGEGPSGDAGAGTAGAGDGCSCAAGQYCRAGDCYDCADLSQLDFDTPEPLLDHPSQALRFPRPGDTASSLFFTLGASTQSELWYEASMDDPPGASLGAAQTPARSGLFFFEDSGNLGFNVVFDELGTDGRRAIQSAAFTGGMLQSVAAAPSPLGPSGADDYSVVLVPSTKRVYWMTTRDGSPALRTGVLGDASSAPVELKIAASGKSCALQSDDAAPWVSPSGTLLLVSGLPLDANCQPLDGTATDLFAAPLNPQSGMPAAPAVALGGVDVRTGASSETDGAFSSDLCTLYYAADTGSALHFRLFRALRR